MNYLFPPMTPPALPIAGDARLYPVRRIFCIGRNYADHAKEMGAHVERKAPLFFMKPNDTLVTNGHAVPWPSATSNLHHEVEMVAALTSGGCDLTLEAAKACVFGYAVGLDLTRRDLQAQAKKKGAPWDSAKGFDFASPVSALCPARTKQPADNTTLSLHINGELKQHTQLADMIWTVPEIIVELSKLFELKPGDLVFTGTPAGVSAMSPGDIFHAELEGIASLDGQMAAST